MKLRMTGIFFEIRLGVHRYVLVAVFCRTLDGI